MSRQMAASYFTLILLTSIAALSSLAPRLSSKRNLHMAGAHANVCSTFMSTEVPFMSSFGARELGRPIETVDGRTN